MFILVVPLKDVRVGDTIVYEVHDRKGWQVEKILTFDGKITLLFGGPFSRTDSPDRLVAVIHRPRREGRTEDQEREFVMRFVHSVEMIPFGAGFSSPIPEIERGISSLGRTIAEYELGKPQE